MPDLTPELGLQEAVLDDDTADYLVDMLGPSLSIVDGLFSELTGHNHAGAHQGGHIEAANLSGPFDFGDWIRSTGAPSPFATTGVGAELYWDSAAGAGVLQSYDRVAGVLRATEIRGATVSLKNSAGQSVVLAADGTLTIPGSLSAPGGLTVTGQLTVGSIVASGDIKGRYLNTTDGSNGVVNALNGNLYLRAAAGGVTVIDQSGGLSVAGGAQFSSWLAVGGNLSGSPGDISANRGNGSGYVFLGNGARYVGFDGSNYVMPNSNLYVNASLVVTETNGATLSSKTLSDPKLTNQTVITSGATTLPNVSGNAGMWRYVKAWGGNLRIDLTNGTLILFGTQYSSGQYTLRSGDSLSCFCDGGNWWVL